MPARARVLDVSDLEAPAPLERVLSELEDLAPGEYIRMLHRREPLLLYPILEQRGFAYRAGPGRATAFEILIWRRDDAAAAGACAAGVDSARREP